MAHIFVGPVGQVGCNGVDRIEIKDAPRSELVEAMQ